jgi:UDP-N-acetylmuramate dehydrogenase
VRIVEQASLRSRNTFGIDARARFLAECHRVADIIAARDFAQARSLPLIVLGGGSNVVLATDLEAVVLIPSLSGCETRIEGRLGEARIGAGESWASTVQALTAGGLYGLENLAAIPGSVGAAPIQNIGAYGVELDRFVQSVDALDLGTSRLMTLPRSALEFGYRDSRFKRPEHALEVIVSVTLQLSTEPDLVLDYPGIREELAVMRRAETPQAVHDAISAIRWRKLPRPDVLGNAGSFFKNPVLDSAARDALAALAPSAPMYRYGRHFKTSAAWLIDACGLKGFRIGAAAVHTDHALVLVNLGGATGRDVLRLADHVADAVRQRFGIDLEIEPRVLGARF